MGKAVMGARNNIVGAIDEATGGKFKPAQQQYASDQAVGDAFEKGLSIFQNRSGVNGLEDRPEYWRAFVANASPAERQALTLGTRTAADQAMGSVRNAALKGETIPQAGFNLDRLKAVIGDKEAATLAKRMTDEQDMAKTNSALFEGSQTQPRQQAKVATAIREIAPLTAEVGLPTFAGLTGHPYTAAGMIGMAAARRGVQLVGRAADRSRNALQAQMLSSSGPAAQDSINKLIALAGQRGLPTFTQGPVGRGANLLLDAAPTTYSQFAEPLPPVRVNRLMKAVGGGRRPPPLFPPSSALGPNSAEPHNSEGQDYARVDAHSILQAEAGNQEMKPEPEHGQQADRQANRDVRPHEHGSAPIKH